MIIFNEREQFENLIKNGFKKFVNLCDLSILAREWNRQGFSKAEIKDKIVNFSKKWMPQFNEFKNEEKIIKALENIEKKPIASQSVFFTKEELEKIKSLDNAKFENVLFVLMCLAKKDCHNYIYLNTNGIYKLSEIFDIANIKATRIEQEEILYYLVKAGAIFCNFKPLLKYDILWLGKDGEKLLEFEPNRDMVMEYERYVGEKIGTCKNCGKLFRVSFKNRKYCPNCTSNLSIEK